MRKANLRSSLPAVVLFLAALWPQSGRAAFLSYVASANRVAPGDTFSVTINLVAGDGSFTFTNFDSLMKFDTNVLASNGGQVGAFLSGNSNFSTVLNPNRSPGVVYVSSSSPTEFTVPQGDVLLPLAVFNFKVSPGATGNLVFTTLASDAGLNSAFYNSAADPDAPLPMGAPVSAVVQVSAVPEPSSVILSALGGGMLLGIGRLRRSRSGRPTTR